MPGAPLRSVPTGLETFTEGSAQDVDMATQSLDADLEPFLGTARTTAVVVAASLLDFLR